MATAIRNIPTLHGIEAAAFLRSAEVVEANPHTIDFSQQTKAVKEYLKTQNWC